MRKYCRICWNNRYWREPTGEASRIETGKSYVQEYGFGHEEWLFNFSWLQAGPDGGTELFKYGFLQPIGKYQAAYEGKSFDVLLYTITPAKERMAVAIIKDLYVLRVPEQKSAIAVMRKNGWINDMANDLSGLGISPSKYGEPSINVRFIQSNVTFFDPRIIIPMEHKLYRINRYQPVNWDDAFPDDILESLLDALPKKSGKPQSEDNRKRAGTEPIEYSPQHARLQNRLYDHLCDVYGKGAIGREVSRVDLTLEESDGTTYFEIKIAPTAKNCIRQALGQLLEYGMYPNHQRAKKLVVVGDGPSTQDDLLYLRNLRKKFGLPIYYRQWIQQSGILGEED